MVRMETHVVSDVHTRDMNHRFTVQIPAWKSGLCLLFIRVGLDRVFDRTFCCECRLGEGRKSHPCSVPAHCSRILCRKRVRYALVDLQLSFLCFLLTASQFVVIFFHVVSCASYLEWHVYRRYSQFVSLNEKLTRSFSNVELPSLPSKGQLICYRSLVCLLTAFQASFWCVLSRTTHLARLA